MRHFIKIGKQMDKIEIAIEKFCLDDRNKRGEILMNFLYQHNLYLINSYLINSFI